jgi:hypothetical protein
MDSFDHLIENTALDDALTRAHKGLYAPQRFDPSADLLASSDANQSDGGIQTNMNLNASKKGGDHEHKGFAKDL